MRYKKITQTDRFAIKKAISRLLELDPGYEEHENMHRIHTKITERVGK